MTNEDNNERNREIAANEAKRETVSNVRVSVWAVAVAVIALGIAWAWLKG